MASNSFGKAFRITTWGESHGEGIGCVIDGCPSKIAISEHEIQVALDRRSPGRRHTSSRKEVDRVQILSGIFGGKTTGAPIALWIANTDVDSTAYAKGQIRPGHAEYTYQKKYGHFDYRGGGRASARETAARVAAGAIARKFLMHQWLTISAWVSQVGEIEGGNEAGGQLESEIFCFPKEFETKVSHLLGTLVDKKDSVGGVVSCRISNVPPSLGEPIYDKIGARLGYGMLSIPACKGIEFGQGFHAASMKGSEHNDKISASGSLLTNNAGGMLGGITTGDDICFRVAFKPTPSNSGRYDPCVAIRAVPVVEAMATLTLADFCCISGQCG